MSSVVMVLGESAYTVLPVQRSTSPTWSAQAYFILLYTTWHAYGPSMRGLGPNMALTLFTGVSRTLYPSMALSLVLFFISVLGFVIYRSHALMLLLALELMLLAVTLMVLIGAMAYDSSNGQTLGIMLIAIAGAESAVGLSVLVAYYRLRGSMALGL